MKNRTVGKEWVVNVDVPKKSFIQGVCSRSITEAFFRYVFFRTEYLVLRQFI